MAKITRFKNENDETIYPITHIDAIYDSNGNTILNNIDSRLENMADKSYVDEAVSNKADKSYVDEAVSDKVDKSYVDEAIANVNVTYDDTEIRDYISQGIDMIDDLNDQVDDLNDQVGDLSALQTVSKNTLVNALNEVFQRGNEIKQLLVDALVAQGADASTNETFEALISKITYSDTSSSFSIITKTALPSAISNNVVIIADTDSTEINVSFEDKITITSSTLKTNKLSLINYKYNFTSSENSIVVTSASVDAAVQILNGYIYLRDCYAPLNNQWTSMYTGKIKPIFSANNKHGLTFTSGTGNGANSVDTSTVKHSLTTTMSLSFDESTGSNTLGYENGPYYYVAVDLTNYKTLVVYMEYQGSVGAKTATELPFPIAIYKNVNTQGYFEDTVSDTNTNIPVAMLSFEACNFSKQTIDVSSLTGTHYIYYIAMGRGAGTGVCSLKVYLSYLE